MSKFFYHIHKKNDDDEMWQVGKEFTISKEQNYFTKIAYNFHDYMKEEQIKDKDSMLYEYALLVRELGMEQARRENFKELPSRHNCIWLCREDQIMYWKSQIGKKEEDIEVYKVEIFDLPVKKRNIDIPRTGISYEETLEQAKKYWENNDLTNYEDDEYLYIGKLKIIDKLE